MRVAVAAAMRRCAAFEYLAFAVFVPDDADALRQWLVGFGQVFEPAVARRLEDVQK